MATPLQEGPAAGSARRVKVRGRRACRCPRAISAFSSPSSGSHPCSPAHARRSLTFLAGERLGKVRRGAEPAAGTCACSGATSACVGRAGGDGDRPNRGRSCGKHRVGALILGRSPVRDWRDERWDDGIDRSFLDSHKGRVLSVVPRHGGDEGLGSGGQVQATRRGC